jgi:uncharacterized membrane protein
MTRGALIAALYVGLTYVSSLLGLASGVIQIRLSEALIALVLIMPEAVVGITLGCFLANIITGAVLWDVIFGTLATLIGALLGRLMRKLPEKLVWLATLPTVISNAVIIPFVLIYAYGAPDAYYYIMLTVGAGELISATLFGTALYYSLKKIKL